MRLQVRWAVAAWLALGPWPQHAPPAADWTRFGWDAGRSSAPPPTAAAGITAGNVGSLVRQQIKIDGTVDASAVYLHGARVNGSVHNVVFVTTTHGKTIAIDADYGAVLWTFTPPGYDTWAGSYRITTATPVTDPNREFLYAAAPDGAIRKLAVADGHAVWSTPVTRQPRREKIASALNEFRDRIIVTTGGYIGDAPPYQGHVAILDAASGRLLHVWNSLCSDRPGLLEPSACGESGSAIWGRAGAVVDTSTGNIFLATGNGRWDGRTHWGDATLELDPDATRLLGNYTPTNTEQLDASDADLGSTSPVLLGAFVAQGGKDGLFRLLDWRHMAGDTPHSGGEREMVNTPSGSALFTAPAVSRNGTTTSVFAADGSGTAAWSLESGQLRPVWHNRTAGTSPVVAGGLLYVYDPGGGLHVYQAETGVRLATLECDGGHWNSPIVVDGKVVLPGEGFVDIWHLR